MIKSTIKAELVALALLIPLVLILSAVLNRYSFSPSPTTTPTTTTAPNTVTASPSSQASALPSVSPTQTVATTAPIKQLVVLNIQSPSSTRSYNISIEEKTTVASVMTLAAKQGITIKTKDYGGKLGLFVTSIDGLANNNQKYWTLYINNKLSDLGMSWATVQPNDSITWKFETLTTNN